MLNADHQTNLANRLVEKMREKVPYRSDLAVADIRMAGPRMATIAIKYGHGSERPNAGDIESFITHFFGGKVHPHMATARVHSTQEAVTLNVTQSRTSTDTKALGRMASIGANRYIEAETNAIWEIEDNNGTPALYRLADEDFEAFLTERRTRQSVRGSLRIASLFDDGTVLAVPNSQVWYYNGNDKVVAKVIGTPDSEGYVAVLPSESTKTTQIHVNQIRDQISTAELEDTTKSKLQKYFEEAFGDTEYARDLVREAVVSGTREDLIAFLTTSNVCDAKAAHAFAENLRIKVGDVQVIGPRTAPNLVLARFHGNGYEWQLDADVAEKLVKQESI